MANSTKKCQSILSWQKFIGHHGVGYVFDIDLKSHRRRSGNQKKPFFISELWSFQVLHALETWCLYIAASWPTYVRAKRRQTGRKKSSCAWERQLACQPDPSQLASCKHLYGINMYIKALIRVSKFKFSSFLSDTTFPSCGSLLSRCWNIF